MTPGQFRSSAPQELVRVRLQLVLEAAQLGLWDWHVPSGLLLWDDRSLELFGTTRERTTGRVEDLELLIHPDDLPRVRAALVAALEAAGSIEVEFRWCWLMGRCAVCTAGVER